MKYLLDTDHISFLQRRAGREFSQLTARMAQYPIEDFALSAISFHEQVIGAHSFINRAKTNADTLRGWKHFKVFLLPQYFHLMLKQSRFSTASKHSASVYPQWI